MSSRTAGGYKLFMAGSGLSLRADAPVGSLPPFPHVSCQIYQRYSWDVLLVASQSSSTPDTRRYKIAASDPRKNAAIVHEYGRDDAYTLVGVDGNPL